MTKLDLPVFEVPELPAKPMPVVVWRKLNDELVRRLKISGKYDRLRSSQVHQPVNVPFRLYPTNIDRPA
jgi:hypothetical protein